MEQSMCIIEDNMMKKKNELLILQKNLVDFEGYQQDKENLEVAVRTQAAQIEQLKLDLQHELESSIKQKEEAEKHISNCSTDSIKSAEQLYRALMLERKRANRVYTLAQHILEQRSEVESFFLAALDQVRDEIAITQKKYSMDAKAAYETRMRLAYYGADEYPQVRTFHQDEATICENMKTAVEAPVGANCKFVDLTWEQKERVLSNLFAQINAGRRKNNVGCLDSEKQSETNFSKVSGDHIVMATKLSIEDVSDSTHSRSLSRSLEMRSTLKPPMLPMDKCVDKSCRRNTSSVIESVRDKSEKKRSPLSLPDIYLRCASVHTKQPEGTADLEGAPSNLHLDGSPVVPANSFEEITSGL
ncbi:hypothetical protein PHET_01277 [Paragonimus heterotremus]|uniref:Uncharacterized protein n=1 Tax=Paragonimus heterotremus TaxID=100268 RepID=A0A8J4TE08_9TREM|nr:hypothetical protein PHET_01277 [Paragonimus heterotremus]